MKGSEYLEKGWRIGVGIVLLNKQEKIFMGERIDNKGSWQMPQGGVNISNNETLEEAAKRELFEETGVSKTEFVSESKVWHYYRLPEQLRKKLWRGKFVGQKQKWFLLSFKGYDHDINIRINKKPEFRAWRWVTPYKVLEEIVSFKKEIYKSILKEFKFLDA